MIHLLVNSQLLKKKNKSIVTLKKKFGKIRKIGHNGICGICDKDKLVGQAKKNLERNSNEFSRQ